MHCDKRGVGSLRGVHPEVTEPELEITAVKSKVVCTTKKNCKIRFKVSRAEVTKAKICQVIEGVTQD